MNLNKPVFLASSNNEAIEQKKVLEEQYGTNSLDNADVIVVLGGDGFMLEAIKSHMSQDLPLFGLNYGSIGFLMNSSNQNDLLNRINQSQSIKISPLIMKAMSVNGSIHEAIAINEVSLLRETHQASKIWPRRSGRCKARWRALWNVRARLRRSSPAAVSTPWHAPPSTGPLRTLSRRSLRTRLAPSSVSSSTPASDLAARGWHSFFRSRKRCMPRWISLAP